MARVFQHPPQGLNYNDYEGSVPNSLLYRLKIISGLSKQTLSIVPTSGQGSVYNGSKIVVSLPMNSLLDLGTFEMNFYEKTAHNGVASGNQKNYVQTRFPPRNIQSLISNIDMLKLMVVLFKIYHNIIIYIIYYMIICVVLMQLIKNKLKKMPTSLIKPLGFMVLVFQDVDIQLVYIMQTH